MLVFKQFKEWVSHYKHNKLGNQEKMQSQEFIESILKLPRSQRVQTLFRHVNITQLSVAKKAERTPTTVSNVFKNKDISSYIESIAYELLREKMGESCPSKEEVFRKDNGSEQ